MKEVNQIMVIKISILCPKQIWAQTRPPYIHRFKN